MFIGIVGMILAGTSFIMKMNGNEAARNNLPSAVNTIDVKSIE